MTPFPVTLAKIDAKVEALKEEYTKATLQSDWYEAIDRTRELYTPLREELAALQAENERLNKLVYVPGVWRCAKCNFRLVSTNLHADSGKFSVNLSSHDCANGCGPMWRVTERDAGNELSDRTNALYAPLREELTAKDAEIAVLPQRETGWLIERTNHRGQTIWWGPPCSRWECQQALVSPDLWTTDANKAVRFARKEDAEAVIRFEGQQHAIATEHNWIARQALSPTPVVEGDLPNVALSSPEKAGSTPRTEAKAEDSSVTPPAPALDAVLPHMDRRSLGNNFAESAKMVLLISRLLDKKDCALAETYEDLKSNPARGGEHG